ncbi:MAG: NAD(P)H-dependent oxidoreductase [Gemmatimonadota bacterium]
MTHSPLPLRLLIIIASTRENRIGPTVARWFHGVARERTEFRVELLDLLEAGLPDRLSRQRPAEVETVGEQIQNADGFIVVTPEYNHSFPAPLKTAIDWFKPEWMAKAVGFVSYGGISGGLRSVEQLRVVFAELHAVTLRDTVSFAMVHRKFEEDGTLLDPEIPVKAAAILLDRMVWWAGALREARRESPYAR